MLLLGAMLPGRSALAELVMAGLDRQLEALPAVLRGVGEDGKARALQLLTAQLELLADGGELQAALRPRLGRLTAALLAALRLSPPHNYLALLGGGRNYSHHN